MLPPRRTSRLAMILGSLLLLELVALALAFVLGGPLCSNLVRHLDTKRSIMLALSVYAVIAVWGFFLDSVIEFWCLAWLVACVQGGSQALSRSLYSRIIPRNKAAEFYGFFNMLGKFAVVFGPILMGTITLITGNPRTGILSVLILFVLGLYFLRKVNLEEGEKMAREYLA